MSIFEDVHVEWCGKRYTIPAKKVMGAIARVEQHVTLGELGDTAGGKIRFAAIACAYASLLRYAGAKLEDDEAYESMFGQDDKEASLSAAINGLIQIIVPPKQRRVAMEAAAAGQEPIVDGGGDSGNAA